MSDEELLALATGPDFEREPPTLDAMVERSRALADSVIGPFEDVRSRGACLLDALVEQAKAQQRGE